MGERAPFLLDPDKGTPRVRHRPWPKVNFESLIWPIRYLGDW